MATLTRQVSDSATSRRVRRARLRLHIIIEDVDPLQRDQNALHRCDGRDHKASKNRQFNAG